MWRIVTGFGATWIETSLLLHTRQAAGTLLMQSVYAVRTALFFFYLLFVFRLLLRNQWAAAMAFVAVFTLLDLLDPSPRPTIHQITTLVYFRVLALAVLRWGLTTLTAAVLSAGLLLKHSSDNRLSSWYLGSTILLAAVPLAVAVWAFRTAIAARA